MSPVIQVLSDQKRMKVVKKYSEMTVPISEGHKYGHWVTWGSSSHSNRNQFYKNEDERRKFVFARR